MAYTIKRTNGNTITIEDNALNTTYGVQLIGKNRLGYGTSLNQNFFRLMENFSYSSAPSNPVSGQLWWDTAGFLKVYTGSVWKEVSSALVSEPATPVNGDLWLDTVNAQLKAYNGTTGTWITVGPSNATTGILNGFVTEAITIGGTDYYIATMYANGQRIAILSKDTLSGTGLTGFGNLNLGLNFSTVANAAIHNANVYASTGTFTGNVGSGNLSAAGILSVTGNANVGNLGGARGIFSSTVTSTSTTTGAVVIAGGLGVAGNVNAAGNVSAGNLSATGATITGNISAGNLSVTGVSNLGNVGNVKILGGASSFILSTDGAGNLTWIAPTSGTINTGNIGRFAYYTGATALSETSANLTWNAGTNTLSLTGNLQATNLTVTSNVTVAGNLIYADATNSRVGVGTTSPGFKVHLYQNDTAFSGNTASGSTINTNLRSELLVSPSSNPTVPFTYYGVLNDTLYNSTANSSNVGIITTLSRTQAINTGNVAGITGHLIRTVVSSSGNVSSSIGQQIALNLTGAGSVATHYNLYIQNPTKSGTGNVVTNYGLYLESQTTGNTTNWGIYSAGGSNYFGGNILVGTTTPSANLTVNGTSNLGPIGNITITGGSSGWVLTTNGSGVLSWSNPGVGVTSITNGTSNVVVANNGNVSLSVAGTSNVMVISSASANIAGTANISGNLISSGNVTGGNLVTGGTLNVTGNANVGNLGAAAGVFTGAITGSTTLNVTGNANVGNLGATRGVFTNIVGSLETASQPNITSVGTLGTLSVSGNANVGNLGISGNITDTGPLVLITAASGNISLAPNGVTTLVTTTTGANVTGTLNVTGNANVGNLGTAGNITASYFFGNGSQLTGITVAAGTSIVNGTSNVTVGASGNVTTAVAGTANVFTVTSTGANVTGTLNVTGNANVGNLGTAGNITASYFFGNGSQLTGITVAAGTSIVNGTSNVTVGASGNVTTAVAGTANVLVVNSGGIGVSANAFLATSSGSVGIGTGSPAHKLDVRSSIARIFNGTASADTTLHIGNADESFPGQGMFLTFHGSAVTPYASINALSQGAGWRNLALLPNGGNVGIGTTSPGYTLDVKGSGTVAVRLTNSGASDNVQLRFRGNQTNAEQWAIGNEIATNSTGRNFDIYDLVSSSNRVRIDSSGNVGIGVTPSNRLHVGGIVQIDQVAGLADLYMGSGTTGNSGKITYDNNNVRFVFSLGASEKMRIESSGNVGIGTTPSYRLHVSGGRSVFVANSEPYAVGVGYSSGSAYWIGSNSANNALVFSEGGGTERMRIDSSGNVLVGTTSSGFNTAGLPLVVGSGSGNTGMTIFSGSTTFGSIHFADTVTTGAGSYSGYINYNHNANSMQFATDASERMRIDSSGNVGIGTSSPGTKLDILGANGTTQQIYYRSSDTNWYGRIGQIINGNTIGSIISSGGAWSVSGATFSATKDFNGSFPTAALYIGNQYNSALETSFRFLRKAAGSTTTDGAVTELMTIDNSGNVGIGTSSPDSKLQVGDGTAATTLTVYGNVSGSKNSYVRLRDFSGASIGLRAAVAGIETLVLEGGSGNSYFNGGGNVGIGTTSPARTLHVHNAVGDNHLYLSNTAPSIIMGNNVTFASSTMYYLIAMATSNGSYGLNAGDTILGNYGNSRGNLYINSNYGGTGTTNVIMQPSSGSVGIGTSSPSQKLHVVGTVLATTFSGSGASLTSIPNSATTATSANTASAIVARDANGDFNARFINVTYFNSTDDVSTGTLTYLMGKFGDNYFRSATAAKVATFISGQTMNISGTATNITAYTINQSVGTGNAPTFAGLTATGRITAQSSQSSVIATATGSLGGLECLGGGSTNAAFMTFHRPGAYAVYFGLDGTDLKVGGWSMGAVSYVMLNENNWTSYTSGKNVQLNSLGVGTAASGTAGQAVFTGKVYGSGTGYRIVLPVGTNYYAV